MRKLPFDGLGPAVLLAAVALAGGSLAAQERPVVSNQIAVSDREASIALEFADRGRLEIAFREGTVRIDGREVGTYTRGDDLETAWRALLGRAVALDDGPLARALAEWSPPTELDGPAATVGAALDRALDDALAVPATAPAPPAPGLAQAPGDVERLRVLLRRTDALEGLAAALEDVELDDRLHLHIAEDVEIGADEEVVGTVVVVDGDLTVRGRVRGDVVVAGGSVRLDDGARIEGDVRLADARLYRDGGSVTGRVRTAEVGRREFEERIRDQVRDEIRREFRDVDRDRGRSGFFSIFRNVGHAVGGVLETLFTLGILSMLGLGVIYFARGNLEMVAEAARKAPGRAAMVGVAGTFLLLPVWVLGIIALAVSIIGIPVLLLWLPLFPVAAALAAGLGYLAVAVRLGEWLETRDIRGLEWVRSSNPFYTMVAGLGLLLAPHMLASAAEIGGSWLGFLRGLFTFVGGLASIAAFLVGFGAVLLTRGGRRPHYERMEWDLESAWSWRGSRRGRSGASVDDAVREVEDVIVEVEEELDSFDGGHPPPEGPERKPRKKRPGGEGSSEEPDPEGGHA